jgi:hypothetical protein
VADANAMKRLLKRPLTHRQTGDILEKRVVALLATLGKRGVRKNVMMRDSNGDLSEIDVAFGWLRPRYIECKHYAPNHPVPLEDVAKFKSVLQLNRISPGRGIFITTSYFTPRATKIGIRTIDGAQLRAWEQSAQRWWYIRMAARGLLGSATVAAIVLWRAQDVGPYLPPSIGDVLLGMRMECGHLIGRSMVCTSSKLVQLLDEWRLPWSDKAPAK